MDRPERTQGTLLGSRVKVTREYIRENGIKGHEQPDLLRNLLGNSPDGSVFYFRDVPEVWTALKAEETN